MKRFPGYIGEKMEVDIKGGMPNSDVCLLINMYCYVVLEVWLSGACT